MWFSFFHSFDASEQQCGQQSLLSVCEVTGHAGTEVSVEHCDQIRNTHSIWVLTDECNCIWYYIFVSVDIEMFMQIFSNFTFTFAVI